MTIGDFASLMMAFGTLGSLVYIARQVRVNRQQAKGQFLLALDAQFEKFNDITVRVLNEPGYVPASSDWRDIWGLMSVFERINIMVEDGILDIGLVDRLHGFRVVGIVANDTIYQRIKAAGADWQDFIDLCYAIAEYRRKRTDAADKAFIERVYKLDKHTQRIRDPIHF